MHPTQLIPQTWDGFKNCFIEDNGRVYRPLNQGDTVSEGQAYTLLIAAHLDDRKTFDQAMAWTEKHLSRKERFDDHLWAWHWEKGKGIVDWNSAADADVDYALALILADKRWKDGGYLQKAKLLLADILRKETAVVGGKRYLLPGSWRNDDGAYVLNPSYFSPAHFRVFYDVTGDPQWMELIETSYEVLFAVSNNFEGKAGVGLVPDWITITPAGTFHSAKGFSNHISWDAIRIPWRLGLHYSWFHEDRAKQYLQRLVQFYSQEWDKHHGRFFVEYAYSGDPVRKYENPAAYAMNLAAFETLDSPLRHDIADKITKTLKHGSCQDQDYYQNSLTLLGLLLSREHTPTI